MMMIQRRTKRSFWAFLIAVLVMTLSGLVFGVAAQSDASVPKIVKLLPADNKIGTYSISVTIAETELNLLVDTGAAIPAVSREVAQRIGLQVSETASIETISGASSEILVSKPQGLVVTGVPFAQATSRIAILDQDLSPRGIDGVFPPQILEGPICLQLYFRARISRFEPQNCKSEFLGKSKAHIPYGEAFSGTQRLLAMGENTLGEVGRLLVDTGSEISLYLIPEPRLDSDDGVCIELTTLSGKTCLREIPDASITLNGLNFRSRRAFGLDMWSMDPAIVGIVGGDVLDNAVLEISGDDRAYITPFHHQKPGR